MGRGRPAYKLTCLNNPCSYTSKKRLAFKSLFQLCIFIMAGLAAAGPPGFRQRWAAPAPSSDGGSPAAVPSAPPAMAPPPGATTGTGRRPALLCSCSGGLSVVGVGWCGRPDGPYTFRITQAMNSPYTWASRVPLEIEVVAVAVVGSSGGGPSGPARAEAQQRTMQARFCLGASVVEQCCCGCFVVLLTVCWCLLPF